MSREPESHALYVLFFLSADKPWVEAHLTKFF